MNQETSTPSKASPYMGRMQHEKFLRLCGSKRAELERQRPTTFLRFGKPGHGLCMGDIDTIVLGEVLDGLRGEFAGEGADAHRGENGAACGEITPEGAV